MNRAPAGGACPWLWTLVLAACAVPACGDEVVHLCSNGSGARACAPGATGSDGGLAPDAPASAGDARASAGDVRASAGDAPPDDARPESAAGEPACLNAAPGAEVFDVPADCHATICDGSGHSAGAIVEQSNVPTLDGPCAVGTCDELGRAGATPRPAGTACAAGPGAKVCDGAGACVECNHTRDCAPGLYCDASHRCGSAPCTDLDCGGACPPCDLGKRCFVDADCRSYACDAASASCIQSQCLDHVQDGNETDLDCGGGICGGCELGQGCLLDGDCLSQACDAVTLQCIADQCADHRADGPEPDVDCGVLCNVSCHVGQRCHYSSDCDSGHACIQKVCR
jgi:hypothetical protein